MVLRPKTWESRSPPGLQNGRQPHTPANAFLPTTPITPDTPSSELPSAGWSSPVARQAHNLKVVGSNPTPATTDIEHRYLPGTAARWGELLPQRGRSLPRSPQSTRSTGSSP